MASQSLYRKWRSQTFSDLIGQEAVTRTLLNAVREGRLSHAYLFCGPRGTGKTSVARLLAKAVNCQNPHDGEPCNECISCREIASGSSPDVIEIDAASNTGVDDIRSIRDHVNLMGGGRHKVYIIDEVHMLSTAACNALLKTLEEPPPHVIFVLATTEAHKVLPTVVSRCQRFDFRRIRTADIVSRLKHVAEGEGLRLDAPAADLLARAAHGGLRDALSLLDQAVAFCGDHVDVSRTRQMLGLADVGAIREMIAYVAEDRAADALDRLNGLVTEGADLRQLSSQFAEEWRALMLARAGADLARLMEYSEDEAREIGALAQSFSLDELMACARVFARNEGPARGLPVPQLALELSLLECFGAHRTGADAAPRQTAAAPQAPRAEVATTRAEQPAPKAPSALKAPVTRQVEELDLGAIDEGSWSGPAAHLENGNARTDNPPNRQAPAGAPAVPQPQPVPSEPEPEPAMVAAIGADGDRDWVAEAQRNWALIRKICKQKPPKGAVAGGLLSDAAPIRAEPGSPMTLVIQAKYDFHLNKLRDPEMRQVVDWALEQALGVPMRAHFVAPNEAQPRGATVRARPVAESNAAPAAQAISAVRTQVYERGAEDEPRRHATGARHGSAEHAMQGASTPAHGHGESRERRSRQTKSPEQLEQAARADPVVQELARMLKAEVTEVKALDAQDDDNE